MTPQITATKSSRFILITIALLALAIVVGGTWFALLPYDILKPFVDSLSADRVDFFTPEFHASLVRKLWMGLFALGLTGIILLLFTRRLAVHLDKARTDQRSFWREVATGCRTTWSELRLPGQLALAAIILLSLVLRLLYMNDALKSDEAHSYLFFASHPIYVGLSYYNLPNNHLLYTAFMHLGYLVFGASVWAVRLPALIFGVLAIPLAYLLGRRIVNPTVGLLTAVIVATNRWMILYSTQGRGYSLQMDIVLLMALLAWHLLSSRNRAAWITLAVLAALCVYTIPTGLYPVTFIWLWLLLSLETGWAERLARLAMFGLLAVAVALLLYTPVFIVSGLNAVIANPYVIPITSTQWLHRIPHYIYGFRLYFVGSLSLALQIILAATLVAGFVWHPWKKQPVPMLIPLAAACVALITLQQVHPYTRVWTWTVPFFAARIAAGIQFSLAHLPAIPPARRWIGLSTGVLLLLAMTSSELRWFNDSYIHRHEYNTSVISAASWINHCLRDGDFIAWNMSFPVLGFYLDKYGRGRDILYSPSEPGRVRGSAENDSGLTNNNPGKVFFIHDLDRPLATQLAEAQLDTGSLDSSDLARMTPVFSAGTMTISELVR